MAVKPWACQFIGDKRKTMPAEEAVQNATDFDLIVAHEFIYQPHTAAMKQANPALKLLVYLNSTFTWRRLDEALYAHDRNGNRVTAKQWTTTYMLELTNPAATAYMQGEAQRLLTSSGYGDLYLDVAGFAPLSPGYVSAVPINPKTGKAWGRTAWKDAINAHIAGIRQAVPDVYILRNCLSSGPSYWKESNAFLIPEIDGAVCEGWLRSSSAAITAYPSEAAWMDSVTMIDDAQQKGFDIYAMTKVWAQGLPVQKQDWYDYAVASFLQAGDGRHSLSVTLEEGDNLQVRDPWRLDLGQATSECQLERGLYQRDYQRGRALVNPTTAPVYADPVAATATAISGTPVTGTEQISVQPNGSLIVQNT